mmetsp:Transcript_116071/g.266385  ORF Transcript_116071/g.266385 Transcript_116071/m.266385 type:complete len:115 (+) Transcript_116071:2703-3047(+)
MSEGACAGVRSGSSVVNSVSVASPEQAPEATTPKESFRAPLPMPMPEQSSPPQGYCAAWSRGAGILTMLEVPARVPHTEYAHFPRFARVQQPKRGGQVSSELCSRVRQGPKALG